MNHAVTTTLPGNTLSTRLHLAYVTIQGCVAGTSGRMAEETHACNCGETFDTLDELKAHAKENHPEAYKENFED